MLQRNPQFLIADIYIGSIHSSEEICVFEENEDSIELLMEPPWLLDFGVDKTSQFQQKSDLIMHWNDESIDPFFSNQ